MATPNTPDIRQYLTTAYSDEDLTILCADYFREVCDDFTPKTWQEPIGRV